MIHTIGIFGDWHDQLELVHAPDRLCLRISNGPAVDSMYDTRNLLSEVFLGWLRC